MNRAIKFRGKSITNRCWIYSMTISNGTIKRKNRNIYFEMGENDWMGVEPATVGQLIGLRDKTGKELYEGDVVQDLDTGYFGEVGFDAITWNVRGSMTEGGWDENAPGGTETEALFNLNGDIEIVGNIHDNPELLKNE